MIRKCAFLLLSPLLLFGKEGDLPDRNTTVNPDPWFTGPLITPSGNIIPGGHYNIEPYLNLYAYTAMYDNDWNAQEFDDTLWNLNPQIIIEVGINKWLDFQITPSWFWNYRKGAAHWEIGDLVAQFDFQLHQDQLPHKSWLPSIKLTLKETFPIGNYQKLKVKNRGTDLSGTGSWITGAELVFSKLLQVYDIHYFNTRVALIFNVPSPVRVKGLNYYGGSPDTKGTFYPPLNYEVEVGFEYNFTRHWALALDIVGTWSGKTRFSGTMGADTPILNTLYASAQYSLAPAIEYNWNENMGIIAGSWFTIAGKNINKFSSAIIAFNYFK